MSHETIERLQRQMEAEYDRIQNNQKTPTDPAGWRAVPYAASAPERGVTLLGGQLKRLFDDNVQLVKYAFSVPYYCTDGFNRLFVEDEAAPGWSSWSPAANEGRVLGGAANASRWLPEDKELKTIVRTIVSNMKARMREDGYNNYYPDAINYAANFDLRSERKNFDRVFWVRNVIAAAQAGDPNAPLLARRMWDWFNAAEDYLPGMLIGFNVTNGMPGGPLMYHSPMGKPEDIQIHQRYYDQEYWMRALADRVPEAFSHYPGHRAHCYCLLGVESMIDEYRATGEERYLNAFMGAWDLYYGGYKHIGGATAICESNGPYPYGSYYITTGCNGETCGSVFWSLVNHRLLQLYPDKEIYAAQIEESLFNILSSCRSDTYRTRYHNRLHGTKEPGVLANTCCEVSSTPFLSDVPAFIYSVGDSGVYVNLYASSALDNDRLSLRMTTAFPEDGAVSIEITADAQAPLHIRIPCWADEPVAVLVNGAATACGEPGSYVTLKRSWQTGDRITFTLPMKLRVEWYRGWDTAENGPRGALLYGPILLALTGDFDPADIPTLPVLGEANSITGLTPVAGQPLTYTVNSLPGFTVVPYWTVKDEVFTCFPVISHQA